ncbi:thiamine pyrophosphate-dependent enzyme [Stella sp.]|uniref:thiamine pyrophosphate-dependent enzyme n=1 Tax=Stella sp. TaxID=2912054 RepID=UPI0035B35A32
MTAPTIHRRPLVARLLAGRDERLLVITGLGTPTYDAAAAGDDPRTFFLWGAMGGATMMGLGLALAQPDRRVLVLAGDGEMLMAVGSLATVAMKRPANLAVVVLDNEHFGETGMQPTPTHAGVDLAGMAAAAGWTKTMTARSEADVPALVDAARNAPGPVFAVAKIIAEKLPFVLPPKDGGYLKDRFREAVLGKA